MYSMVLMAALTTGTATPACHWRSCHGCSGGYNGCWGGYGACHGCNGSYGGWRGHGGNGYSGCNCYGGGNGCWGGYGGCYGCWGGYGACHGCSGGWGYAASPYAPAYVTPAVPEAGKTEKVPAPPKKTDGTGTSAAASAQLIVELPADAKLYIDDSPMKTTAAKRTFNTPPLQPGHAYYYMLRAEVERDGQTLSQTARVIVRAGEVSRANFSNLDRTSTVTTQASSR
jgi:uncharacterized protein (TIGR03000 family)